MESNKKIGHKFEKIAANFLIKQNYEVLKLNYHSKFGEIDIIAKKNTYIHFIEVKYRKNIKYGYPREAVSLKKQEKIKLTALTYIEQNNLTNFDISFDIIEIIGEKITLIANAFC